MSKEMVYTSEHKEVASTILEQLGGSMALAMIGAINIVQVDEECGGVSFKFFGCRKMNHCKIVLTSNDTYRMTFYKITRRDLKKQFVQDELYWDDLRPVFMAETGLILSL